MNPEGSRRQTVRVEGKCLVFLWTWGLCMTEVSETRVSSQTQINISVFRLHFLEV